VCKYNAVLELSYCEFNMKIFRLLGVDIRTECTQGAYTSLVRPTSLCVLFDGENISFDFSLVIYINSTNIPPIMIINRINEHQNLLSL